MKILTLNTWQERGPWRERWDIIFEGLKKYQPEVAAFQEVFNPGWARQVQKKSGYPFLVFAREPSGLMFLSKYPVRKWECLTLKTQSATEEYKRYALFAELDIEGIPAAVFNTHLSWKLDEGHVRENQVGEFLGFIKKKSGDTWCAAMGDFNSVPQSPEVLKVKVEGGFRDAFGELHPQRPGNTWDNRNPYAAGSSVFMPERRIDFIFWKPAAKRAESFNLRTADMVYTEPVDGIFASDHFGVLAEFNR
jgi:endonuclease/exonuclease/phosphatase family metal-dependent hydrolase